jgi:hypothetical protein
MVNIPNKANGEILYATELMKVGAIDMTGGTSNTIAETQVTLTALSANQITTGALYLIAVEATCKDTGTGSNSSVTFNLKLGPSGGAYVTKQSLTIRGGDHAVGTPTNGGGGMLMYWDTAQDYTAGVEVQLTASMSTTQCQAIVLSVVVIGV